MATASDVHMSTTSSVICIAAPPITTANSCPEPAFGARRVHIRSTVQQVHSGKRRVQRIPSPMQSRRWIRLWWLHVLGPPNAPPHREGTGHTQENAEWGFLKQRGQSRHPTCLGLRETLFIWMICMYDCELLMSKKYFFIHCCQQTTNA